MLVLIRGAGDLATGTALRLHRAGLSVVMTDLPHPTAIRRTVCFSEAIVHGRCTVEDVTAVAIETPEQAAAVLAEGHIPILADPEGTAIAALHPDAVADVILAKRNLGTKITDAPIVVAAGPGFTAGPGPGGGSMLIPLGANSISSSKNTRISPLNLMAATVLRATQRARLEERDSRASSLSKSATCILKLCKEWRLTLIW